MSTITISGNLTLSGALQMAGATLAVPSKATNFSPADASTYTTLTPTLSWSTAAGATSYDVYLDPFNPPTTLVSSAQAGLTYTPSARGYATTYFWRINPKNGIGTTTGDVSAFTTIQRLTADAYIDFLGKTAGTDIDATVLGSAYHGTLGTASLVGTTASGDFTVQAGGNRLHSDVLVGATTYTAGNTNSMSLALLNSNDFTQAKWLVPNSLRQLTMAGWFTPNVSFNVGQDYDLVQMSAKTTGYSLTVKLRPNYGGVFNGAPAYRIGVESGAGGVTTQSTYVAVVKGDPIWISFNANFTSGAVELKVYNSSNVLLFTTTDITAPTGNDIDNIKLGNGENGTDGGTNYFENWIVDYTNHVSPLGP